MDDILFKAIRELKRELARVPDATREEKEEFIRAKTEGKYGYGDAIKILAKIDTDVSPRNVGRSLAQGAAMEWADELVGAFGGSKEEMRLRDELFKKAHPVVDGASRFAGGAATGLLIPGGTAATVARAAGRGALIGAGAGAASGAGAAEEGERGAGAVTGAAVGGAMGGALPFLVGGVGSLSPRIRAERRVNHAINKSGGKEGVSKELARHVSAGRGDEVMLGDLSDRLRLEADFAANNSDDVFASLAKTTRERQGDMSDRLVQDVKELGRGDANHIARGEAMTEKTRQWAREAFGELRERGADIKGQPVGMGQTAVPHLGAVLQQPVVRNAWQDAQKVGLIGDMPDLAKVSLEKLQNVKFDLDDAVTTAFRQGRGNLASRLAEARDELVRVMEVNVPGYKATNAEYGKRMRVVRALEDGAKAWMTNDSRKLASQVKKLSVEELETFRYGMASQLLEQLRSAQTNRDVAAQLMQGGKTLQAKLQVVFGSKQKFDEFMQRVASEADLGKMKGAVGNSATARRTAAAGFDPAELGINAATGGASNAVTQMGAKLARGAMSRRTAAAEGPMLQTKGAPAIESLLQSWQTRDPLLHRMFTNALPAGIPSLMR
jgi:hypothetical protein